jgi:hypothetical protein
VAYVRNLEEFSATAETAVPELCDRLVCRVSSSLAPNSVHVARRC